MQTCNQANARHCAKCHFALAPKTDEDDTSHYCGHCGSVMRGCRLCQDGKWMQPLGMGSTEEAYINQLPSCCDFDLSVATQVHGPFERHQTAAFAKSNDIGDDWLGVAYCHELACYHWKCTTCGTVV